MSWPRSVLTDSGGFQIFSLPRSRSITIMMSPPLNLRCTGYH
jgi:tRNA-guanine family transglycosylase